LWKQNREGPKDETERSIIEPLIDPFPILEKVLAQKFFQFIVKRV